MNMIEAIRLLSTERVLSGAICIGRVRNSG